MNEERHQEMIRRFERWVAHLKQCRRCRIYGRIAGSFFKLSCREGNKLYRAWYDYEV